tara:strand:- start:240 stop:941 length:702 start_codon:yes stop_codon:yes gene_type:complete
VDYPEGTVVAKTFLYPNDFRDLALGQRVIETRLMVKTDGVWNVATYIWNDEQTDATLSLVDVTTTVHWISPTGESRSTAYEIPGEVACVTCHQSSEAVTLLGLTPRNLNQDVMRGDEQLNQLDHLVKESIFQQTDAASIKTIINYEDTSHDIEARARAYLDANCSHCHHPNAWKKSARQDLDLRYDTPLAQTGIQDASDTISKLLREGEMPLVGTTMLDEDGVKLTLDYLDTL